MVVKGETDAPPIQWVSALFVREDQSLAAALVAELAGRDVPFPDAQLVSVDIYQRTGSYADIDAATVVLAVCSPASTRDVPFLDQAKHAHGRTFAVTLADVPSLPGELGGVQPFDLSGWQGDTADPRLDELARALISALADRAAPGSADGSAATAEGRARRRGPVRERGLVRGRVASEAGSGERVPDMLDRAVESLAAGRRRGGSQVQRIGRERAQAERADVG